MSKTKPPNARVARILPEPSAPESSDAPGSEERKNPSENPRLSLPYNPETGKIDFSSMRASTREKLKRALADPSATEALGTSAATIEGAPDQSAALNTMIVNTLYDAISSLAVVLAKSRGFQATHAEMLRYTQQEKEMFAPLTINVLNKYDLLGGKYAEEMMLLAAIGAATATHVQAMTAAAASAPVVPPL